MEAGRRNDRRHSLRRCQGRRSGCWGWGLWWRSERAADAARRLVLGRDATDNPPKRRTLTLLTEAQDEAVRIALALARQVAEEVAGEQSPTGTLASRLLWAVEAAEDSLASAAGASP